MASNTSPAVTHDRLTGAGLRKAAAERIGVAIEAGVLVLVCLAPWAFGATAPKYVFLLDVGVACLMVLWGLRGLLEGRLTWRKCPVAACLIALILVGVGQIAPLPKGLLRHVSPSTARMYDQVLPARPEALPPADQQRTPIPLSRPGSTISIDPGATRQALARLLAVLMLFALVRNNIDPAGGLKHLGIAALANGSLLALFGLVQAFSSKPQTIYWVYSTTGGPFGPFINRNHYAFYMNVCVGLGAGILLGRAAGRGSPSAGWPSIPGDRRPGARLHPHLHRVGWRDAPWTRLLLDPMVLGLAFALGLMMSSVVFCLSRGGFLALLGGLFLMLFLWLRRSRGTFGGGALVLILSVALALVCWFGFDRVATRLATLPGGDALSDSRLAYWARALPVVRDFPLWGTGYGTYEFADMWHRTDAVDADTIVDHAHNDYLEMLLEGGLAQLVPGILAIVLVFRLGLKAVGRIEDGSTGGLALGALMAFAAVTIHSVSDFGLHIPSCAALVAVLCALLCGLGSQEPRAAAGQAGSALSGAGARTILSLRGFSVAFRAGLALAFALVLAHEGWRVYRVQQIQGLAADLDRSGDPARLERKVAYLEAAARLVPENAQRQVDVAFAHLNAFEQRMYELVELEPADAGNASASSSSRRGPDPQAVARLKRQHLRPALRHLLCARDLSPLRAMVHLEIADHVAEFTAADLREAYLERAKLLAPADPDLWYRCGIHELADGRPDRAWASWRRSLALSDLDLPQILRRSQQHLDARGIVRDVLPDRPDLLLRAAGSLYPQTDVRRRPFLEQALTLLEHEPDPPSAQDWYTRATIHRDLGQPAKALVAYRKALLAEPGHSGWRYELAELSYEQGRYEDAHQELLTLLALEPRNVRARAYLDTVARGLAEHR